MSPLFAPPASAINIILNYNAAASNEPTGDPTGALLIGIMQHVEATYQDIFEDTHTLTINYWYEALPAPFTGDHDLVSQSGGRETVANIRFDPNAQTFGWFWDATPGDDSEYNMTQTLWRDLTATDQQDHFNVGASIPRTFEVGWGGSRNGSNPNTLNRSDLLSVAFHEVGHSLGMSAANISTVAETADGDYDFDIFSVFGRTLAAETADGTGGPNTNIAHLSSPFGLMDPGIGTNVRRRPSHTDLLSMAAGHDYSDLDFPRREYYGGSMWHFAGNWSGNSIPDANDDAFVRAAGPTNEPRAVAMNANAVALNLFVSEGGFVDVRNFVLSVGDNILLDGGSTMLVGAGGTAQTDVVTVQSNSNLTNNGGAVLTAIIRNSAQLAGNGTFSANVDFINDGTINVSGGTMTLIGPALNLDGIATETGVINVLPANADLVVNGTLTDNFNGDLNIGPGNSATFTQPWTIAGVAGGTIVLGSDGVLNLNGGTNASSAAVLAGAGVTVIGDLNVPAGSFGRIDSASTFSASSGGAQVVVNGDLTLADATYLGGSLIGGGVLHWEGDVVIAGNTTVNVTTLDADGNTLGDSVTINGVTLTINSNLLDAYTGALHINSGTLAVNSNWSLDGSMTLNAATAPATVSGGQLSVTGGTIHSIFNGAITAPTRFLNGTVNVASGFFETSGPLSTPANGTMNKTGPGAWIISGAQTHSAGATMNVNAGAVFLNTNAGAGGANLDIAVLGGSVLTSTSQHLDSVAIAGGMSITAPGNTSVLRMRSLEIVGSGVLNLTDETLIVDYNGASPFNSIRTWIDSGHNNGSWTGFGITSSLANNSTHGVGYAESGAIFTAFPATFAGESVDSTAVLVRLTRYGDANLDQVVNLNDFNRLAANFGASSGAVWSQGDFNYDGLVNLSDFNLLAANFGLSAGPDGVVDPHDWAALASVVPEPAGAVVFAAAAGLIRRRSRARGSRAFGHPSHP